MCVCRNLSGSLSLALGSGPEKEEGGGQLIQYAIWLSGPEKEEGGGQLIQYAIWLSKSKWLKWTSEVVL